ncbi:MAG: hypothetical protein ACQGVC_06020 [Myxococcota bacterium]
MEALSAQPSDVLFTLAEVAVAFAGFASIVAVFQVRLTPAGTPFDLFRFWVMLAFSLATLLFSLVPFLLHFLGLDDAAVWRVSSVLLGAFVLGNGAFVARLIVKRVPNVVSSLDPAISIVANLTYLVALLAQAANVLGAWGGPGFGLYLLGLLMILLGAAVNFVRLVWVGTAGLRPRPE